MFLPVVFLCLLVQLTSTINAMVDPVSGSSVSLPNRDEVVPSPDTKNLASFQEMVEQLERKVASLTEEVGLLRKTWQNKIEVGGKRMRRRRDVTDNLEMTSLPKSSPECIPGTNGCPISVIPYSAAGSCILCPAGPRGYPGPAGPPGRDGRDAIALVTTTGNSDSGRIDVPCRPDVSPASNTSGAVYIRWGHHGCPSSSSLIYSGTAAAPSHLSAGNGADQLCLPQDPVYDEPVAGVGGSRAFLYGLEYQIDSFPARSHRLWHDVPCAVCKAPSRFAKLMVPGKNSCPSDEWTLEYGGYLMAERSHSVHHRSLHICVDREMQVLDRTSGGASGNARALLNLVEGRCSSSGGGIPCGPYVDGFEITCAVCTQ